MSLYVLLFKSRNFKIRDSEDRNTVIIGYHLCINNHIGMNSLSYTLVPPFHTFTPTPVSRVHVVTEVPVEVGSFFNLRQLLLFVHVVRVLSAAEVTSVRAEPERGALVLLPRRPGGPQPGCEPEPLRLGALREAAVHLVL